MGLIEQLGYRVPEANRFNRLLWKLSSTRLGARFFAKSAHHIDRALLLLSGGRVTRPEALAGIPVITVATTRARTGQRREVPLGGVPSGGNIAVIGSNLGQRRTPGWYFNLQAEPRAEIAYRGRTAAVIAREADGEEREAAYARGCHMYTGYKVFVRRVEHRRPVHVIVLEPNPAADPPPLTS